MFGFFRKKTPAPPLCSANPGVGTEAKVAFSNGARSWSEQVDMVRFAAKACKQRGYRVTAEDGWLLHGASGFQLVPQLVNFEPLDRGGVRTVTTMQVNHPALAPQGVFEYQHSTGDNLAEAITLGIDQWLQTDFLPLLQALQPQVEACMAMEMTFPAQDGRLGRVRRAVFGPVAHFRHEPEPSAAPEEHPFCNCCLFTRSIEAFRDLVEADGFFGLRLYAARDPDNGAAADCRVNGEDWEPGMAALRAYVETWPGAGFEFRKQYVVLQSVRNDLQSVRNDV